jgi:DNA-binding response OmpR family regulator
MKILVVEDEHKIAQFIKTGLELESWSVDLTYDGEEGLDLASSEPYDVIILDLMLPRISGLELLGILRKKEHIHTPILVLTAKGATDDKVECLNAGADDYLIKPFVFAELVARVRALSRRPKQQIEGILKLGNLTLNTVKREVKRAKEKISLSKREYALLEFLLKHKGEIKNKDEIIQNIWSYEDDILPNTVEVYINYLREKLDKPFPSFKPLIHTVRGFGYKIDTHE